MGNSKLDVIALGRSSIDLYSQDIGADFVEITGFDAFVGGSPLNIAVGCARLGLKSGLLTAVGDDKVGDFILNFLRKENVETGFIPRIPQSRTSAVVLGIEPPDKFPLVFYRENAADSQLSPDHVLAAQIESCSLLEISGTSLNKEPSRSSAFLATEIAINHNIPIIFDLDFRADQWFDPLAFGITVRAILPRMAVVIGTEEEILAAVLENREQIEITDQQISAPKIRGDVDQAIDRLFECGVQTLIVKRGEAGVSVFEQGKNEIKVPGFPVDVLNVLGAGDAFASGFIYGYLKGWDLFKSCRMGNASGAQVVLKPGCANFMPSLEESLDFIERNGGF